MKKEIITKELPWEELKPLSKEVDNAATKLRSVIENTIKYYETNVFPDAIEIIKAKNMDNSDRAMMLYQVYGKDRKFRSNERYPLMQQMIDVFCANLYDSDTKARAIAFDEEDQWKTEMAQDFYDWAYWASNASDEKEVIRNEAVLLWTSYAKAWFRIEDKQIEYVVDGKVKKSPIRKVREPELTHINFFNIFLPPDTKDFYKAKWIWYRYISTFEDVKSKYSQLWVTWSDKDTLFKSAPLSTYDYSRVYDSKWFWNELLKRLYNWTINSSSQDWYNKEMFNIDMEKNKMMEVVEYREWDRMCLLINGQLKYDWVSPYPDKPPFLVAVYERQPWTYMWKWIGHKLITLQKEADLVHNGIKDTITMGLYPMFLIPKWTMRWPDWKAPNILYWMPSKVIEVINNTGNAWIETLKLADLNYVQLAQNHMQFILWQASEIIWVNSYISWGQAKVERTSTWVNQRIASMRSRLQPIINSLNRLDSELFQQWLAMATVFMEDEVKVRVVGQDWFEKWWEVKISDILNRFDVVAENEANRASTKELRSAQSLDAVLKLSSINKHPITWMPYYDMTPAIQKVAENFNFEALKQFTPEELQIQLQLKAEYDKIMWVWQQQQQQPQDIQQQQPIIQQLPQSSEAVNSWFAWDLFKDINRSWAQI